MSFFPMHSMLERLRRIVGTNPGEAVSDAQLLSAYAGGRVEAFEALVCRHGRMVHGVCRRVLGNVPDADDAFQAVFMVLARRAGSLTGQESVASWLYGVACRTAKRARDQANRRRRREEVVATMTREETSADEVADAQVASVLDEEVNRLPKKYRQPVLLCYLAGESNEEAARRMRCSVGAVKMRLLRARELLRGRLERRGVTVPAVALGILLEREASAGSMPASLLEPTLTAAHAFAAGSASGAVGPAALAQGVIREMYLAKMKWLATVVIGIGAVTVGIGLSVQGREPVPPAPRPKAAPVAKEVESAPKEPAPRAVLGVAEYADQAAVVNGNNRFGLELLRKTSKPDANAFISPYSISAALSMTYAGARGDTATEIANTLHFSLNQPPWHQAFGALSGALRPTRKEPAYQLHIANRLWGQSGAQFHEAFLKTTRDHYGAGIQPLDFRSDTENARKTINAWVEKQTKEKIKDLIQKRVLSQNTRLVLTNAIYFKSDWEYQFKPARTQREDFRTGTDTVKTQMMHQTETFGYADSELAQIVSLPYRNNALSMVIILPKKVDGLAAVEKDLDAARLKEYLEPLKRTGVELSLPKFKLEESCQLGDALKAMGMPKAFSPTADFSGIADEELHISSVVHRAMVNLDENGTEAAAATAVLAEPNFVRTPEKTVAVKADHPFLFLIRENKTGTVLFLGRLVKPATK